MDFTLQGMKRCRQRQTDPTAEEMRRRKTDYKCQEKAEEGLIELRPSACPKLDPADFEMGQGLIETKELAAVIDQNYDSYQVQERTACFVEWLFSDPARNLGRFRLPLTVFKGMDEDDEDDMGLHKLAVIGAGLFVFKMNTLKPHVILHEAIVGLYGTNALRRVIPNFAFVYGCVKCHFPSFDQRGDLVLCPRVGEESYAVIYEMIPGRSLSSHLPHMSAPLFVSIYIQLILSLEVARRACGFSHGDTNTVNIILRPAGQVKTIDFPLGKEVLRCKTNGFVATWIDFEGSYIEIESEPFPSLWSHEADRKRPTPIEDAFSLLLRCLKRIVRYAPKEVYMELVTLVRFFTPIDEPKVYAEAARPFAPRTPATERITLLQLVQFCRDWLKERKWPDPLSDD